LSMTAAVQHLAIGLATVLAGMLMSKSPAGRIVGYDIVGYTAAAFALAAIFLAGQMRSGEGKR